MPQFEFYRSAIIEKICQAPPKQRRRLIDRVVGIERKRPEKSKRLDFDRKGKWSKDLIAEVLKSVLADHGKVTIPLLRKLRKEDPNKYPPPTTVYLRFGSWDEAKKAAGVCQHHENVLGNAYEEDVGYFLSLYHQFGVTTRDLYYEARQKFPKVVPPYNRLKETFGSFRKFKEVAKLDSCSEQIERLLILIESLGGRWPKRALCKENGVDIKYLDERFGGRKELREFVFDLRRVQKRKDEDN